MWAPEIHFVNNKYHIYYSAKNKITGWHALGLAISENPLGPYTGKSFSDVLILASWESLMYIGSKIQILKNLTYYGKKTIGLFGLQKFT